MKLTQLLTPFVLLLGTTFALSSCEKKQEVVAKNEISEESMSQIRTLGFSTQQAQKVEGGVLVEGDILLTNEMLTSQPDYSMLRVGQDEQYRTNNLVGSLPRSITVSIASSFSSGYVSALDEAIRRYNEQNLRISFRRVSSGAAISILRTTSGSFLASAGFPSDGNPYNQITVNTTAISGSGATVNSVATILAHEMGHCIGFRHTDYADRSYSCGGQFTNEGASSVGAIQISGTPAGPDPNSWMLACVGSGVNRPFNGNDVTALNFLY